MEDRSRQHDLLKVIICGGVILAFAMGGAVVIVDRMADSEQHLTGTILARYGSTCQRLVVDNSTGAIKSSQQIPCGDPPKEVPTSVEAAPSRYSGGGGVDAIRDSFRNR